MRRPTAVLVGLLLLIGVIAAAPKAWSELVVAVPAAWSWFLRQNITPGHGTVIGGFFVVAAAVIAYTGTHLTRTSNERNADRSHNRADLQELRRRFITTAAQFADPSPEVRLAGVYALEALTDDWIDRQRYIDAQTCINYLCGYLTRPYEPPIHNTNLRRHTTRKRHTVYNYTDETYEHPRDDLHVRQAITRTIATHLKPDHHHNWSNYNYDLTGAHFHNADFTGSQFRGTIDFSKTRFHGERTDFDNAEFHSETTSFDNAEFHSDLTTFDATKFRSKQTTFDSAYFRNTAFAKADFNRANFRSMRTSFDGAKFLGDHTSFWCTGFHGSRTTFDRVEFRSDHTSFLATQFRSVETTFYAANFYSELTEFPLAEFHSLQTTFGAAVFHTCGQTSFVGPAVWNNVHVDWDSGPSRRGYGQEVGQPASVIPEQWPPFVVPEG